MELALISRGEGLVVEWPPISILPLLSKSKALKSVAPELQPITIGYY